MIGEAIEYYHNLLKSGYVVEDTQTQLTEELEKCDLFFEDVPACRVLRPQFYTYADWVYLKRHTELVLGAFRKAYDVCMNNRAYRAQLELEPYEEELFVLDKGFNLPCSSSRLGTFFKPEDQYLRFVGYDAETPAELGFGDELAQAFFNLDVMKTFKKSYHVGYTPSQQLLMDSVINAYKAWGGTEQPNIAIVDWQSSSTLTEHQITQQFFEGNGYKTILADPRDLEYHHDYLWKGDVKIHIIYKHVPYNDLMEQMGDNSVIIQAIKDRAVFLTNAPSTKLMAKKASLALMSDEENRDLFTADELATIRLHIPWTRRVTERKTFYRGQEIDLIQYIADNRENFVLKPNDDDGEQGVVLGFSVTQQQWDWALKEALRTPFIVQEAITLVERAFPAYINNELVISNRFVDANPYVFNGDTVGGCLARLSSVELSNVMADMGSVVPMMVIEPI